MGICSLMNDEPELAYGWFDAVLQAMPGEVAPAHRHSQSALRFVMDGAGAQTSVDGERTIMQFGDFVITPPGAWHDHGNESGEPMIWLDGLDIPIVSVFDASFAEEHHDDRQPITRQTEDSSWRFGANMLPVDYERTRLASPIFNYPYERSREALAHLEKQGEIDPCHGIKMRYITQARNRPPTFIVFGTRLDELPESYNRYLVNSLRDDLDLKGLPIRINMRSRKNPFDT